MWWDDKSFDAVGGVCFSASTHALGICIVIGEFVFFAREEEGFVSKIVCHDIVFGVRFPTVMAMTLCTRVCVRGR